jgi:hypothetical protein
MLLYRSQGFLKRGKTTADLRRWLRSCELLLQYAGFTFLAHASQLIAAIVMVVSIDSRDSL